MATQDISRSAFDHRKHYRGVQLQQGRVVYDDDWNEGAAIELEERRRDLVRVIGPYGSPDAGFLISGVTATGKIDFNIGAGSFYVGGLRAELEQDDQYAQQEDWLEQGAADRTVPAAERIDLAYLEAWEQPVTSVEDSELFEAALGGADTSTRVRTMARVRLEANVATDDCAEAWAKAVDRFKQAGRGTLNAEHELVRALSLKVDFPGGTNMGDLCSPFVAGGYLGAENQAIRVQLTQANRLTWGFDNASRLYRVNLGPGLKDVKLQVDPKDPTHWPLAGQTVELLPWAALLPNGEKLAAWSGHVDTVATSYDPDFRTLTLTTGVSGTFGKAWEARSDKTQLGSPYVFMRVWDRGADRSNPELDFTAGPVTLGQTGLRVTVTGSERQPGDHWIVAARPETPRRVVPWELEQGLRTRGPRVFVAPLGLIHWKAGGGGAMTGTLVHDCRRTFRPLTRIRNCCTYTVGDGNVSHGDFESIQAAISKLPASGGEICVLPGEYEEVLELSGRSNVTIRGCGGRSVLMPPTSAGKPAIRILDSVAVTIKALAIESAPQPAVSIEQTSAMTLSAGPQRRTVLRELEIRCRDRGAIRGTGDWIDVLDCDIVAAQLASPLGQGSDRGRWPTILLHGDDVRIEGNRIVALRNGGSTTALGGVQLGGGSERVELRRNVIEGGNGDGVTLGSLLWAEEKVIEEAAEDWEAFERDGEERPTGERIVTKEDGCIEIGDGTEVVVDDDDGTVLIPASAGALADIRVLDNDIRDMGGNGIGVVLFFDLDKHFDVITVDNCTIEDNRILGCLRLERGAIKESLRPVIGFGGIALADGERPTIRANRIEGNGPTHLEPVCGVFLLHPQGALIEGNRIVENGIREDGDGVLPGPGHRGGIVIPIATTVGMGGEGLSGVAPPEVFAARVHANVVVAPEGRAVKIGAIGPVAVQGNRLVTHGADGLDLASAMKGLLAAPTVGGLRQVMLLDVPFGVTVTILNFGTATELYGRFTGAKSLALGTSGTIASPVIGAFGGRVSSLAQGSTLFAENQVTLDLSEAGLANESSALSSLLVASMDDVGFHDNQCECFLESELLIANAIAGGWSVRVSDNRFKEPLWSGFARTMAAEPTEVAGREIEEVEDGEVDVVRPAAAASSFAIPRFSAITLGLMNAITNNQGTHCFFAAGPPALRINRPNTSLVDVGGRKICKRMTAQMRQLSGFLLIVLVGATRGGGT